LRIEAFDADGSMSMEYPHVAKRCRPSLSQIGGKLAAGAPACFGTR